MNITEFLSSIKTSKSIFIAPASSDAAITLCNTALQNLRAAMLPTAIQELYKNTGAINLGNGYIFGPTEISRSSIYPIPSIVDINRDFSFEDKTYGKTIFARNDLFLFSFDAFGNFYMQDNLTLKTLKKYENPYQAMTECLLSGRF